MTETEHLLDVLIEECAEVIQRATKAKRFGMWEIQPEQRQTNIERLIYELNDLVATADLLLCKERAGWLNEDLMKAKQEKVLQFLEYSETCGTLTR